MSGSLAADVGIAGWREALLIVADLELWKQVYLSAGDWEVLHEGRVDDSFLKHLNAPGTPARQAVLARKHANTGHVRLVSLGGVNRYPVIRSNGRPWETGGWFDLNSRVENIEEQFFHLQDMGWCSVSDPVEWTFGTSTVKEWLAYGPDGVNWAIIERISPPLDADAQPGRLGAHFNSTQVVDDIRKARAFYESVLGFKQLVHVENERMPAGSGQNVLGLPKEVAAKQRWNITMLSAPEPDGGSVELLSLPGLSGRDFAARTDPPNRGIVSLRFPVRDLRGLQKHLANAGVRFAGEPEIVELPPHGAATLMTVYGPCGVRLDFFQSA